MSVLTAPKTSMLYCPKCNNIYEDGTQRFCTNDGSRLLSANAKSGVSQKNVFASVLNKANSVGEKNGPKSKMFKDAPDLPVFDSPAIKEKFSIETNFTPEKKVFEPRVEKDQQAEKPKPRLIKPFEIPFSQAKLGDRTANPTGRLALTWENTAILLGQTVKGRYYIVEQLSEDETSVAYLAEDKIVSGKKVVVRVLMEEKDVSDFESKIFAEERVSLSHINHPHIAHLIDSGELLEGKSFIVSEYVEGVSLKEKLRTAGQFDSRRAGKIIRQIADALGEAHQNGVLHRNLNPTHIILNISQNKSEQIKVTDFAVFDGKDEPTDETIKYLSPEQIEGRMPNVSSDIYSLAVIAYQMLTGRMPFNFSSEKEILKAQKEGLSLRPTNLRLDLSPQVDEVLEKALSYKATDRYPKARDFGDALFNALITAAVWEKPSVEKSEEKDDFLLNEKEALKPEPKVTEEEQSKATQEEKPEIVRGKILPVEKNDDFEDDDFEDEVFEIDEQERLEQLKFDIEEPNEIIEPEKFESEEKKIESDEIVEKPISEESSAAPLQTESSSNLIYWILGIIVLAVVAIAGWNFLSKRQTTVSVNNPETNVQTTEANQPVNTQPEQVSVTPQVQSSPVEEVETPPSTRQIIQPPNTALFQNTKENLNGELAQNFRGFSFYYPNDWVKTPSSTNFADVARIGATGTPIEQFLVSYYDSKGTYSADREIFPQLADQSIKDLEKALDGKFTLISQGETRINGEWKAYEMKFQAEGKTINGDKVTLWGRRLWLPAAKNGVKTGFILTLLATSISPEVNSANDVGVKGELAQVLSTFEPTSLNASQ